MGNCKEDTDQNFRTIFFLFLFFLFIDVYSTNQEINSSTFKRNASHYELELAISSVNHNAAICTYNNFPDIHEFSLSDIQDTRFNPFSIQLKLLNFNNKTVQDFVNNQKSLLTIKPLLLWRLNNTLSLSDKGDLPVLS